MKEPESNVNLYCESDIALANEVLRKEILRLLVFVCFPLVLTVFFFIRRQKWFCITAAFLFCSTVVFLMDLKVLPAFCYNRWLHEILHERHHETAGTLISIGTDYIFENRLCFKEVMLNEYTNLPQEGERRFLMDAGKSLPQDLIDHTVVITSHETFITGIRLQDEGESNARV